MLKSVKGIGWYIEEYGVAQLSLNLTNINITPVHWRSMPPLSELKRVACA